jgi:hypothetical protein
MVPAFSKLAIGATVLLMTEGLTTNASAVTLSYEYSGTGNVSFQSNTTIDLGGSCASPCVVSALMTIGGNGPIWNPSIPSGWATNASATITDNLGDKVLLGVDTGNYTTGTKHETFGGVFFPSTVPSTLDINTSSFASILGGSGTIEYSISINLPNGVYVTPLPAALSLFATGLGSLALLGWRRKREAACDRRNA